MIVEFTHDELADIIQAVIIRITNNQVSEGKKESYKKLNLKLMRIYNSSEEPDNGPTEK